MLRNNMTSKKNRIIFFTHTKRWKEVFQKFPVLKMTVGTLNIFYSAQYCPLKNCSICSCNKKLAS